MQGGALATVNKVPGILTLKVLYCENKCTSVYLPRYCTGFSPLRNYQECALRQSRQKRARTSFLQVRISQ